MRELKRTYRIFIGTLVFLFIILIGFLTLHTQKHPFVSGPEEVLLESIKGNDKITPPNVAKSIISKDEKFVFVDVRSQYDFVKGHLPNAKNIYSSDILDEENFNFFESLKEDDKIAILYGESVTEANIPYMILKQIGIKNLKLLNCGYDFFKGKKMDEIVGMTNLNLDDEVAMINFSKYISDERIKDEERIKSEENQNYSNSEKKTVQNKTVKKTVLPKRKLVIPEPEEEEEDEGC